MKLIKLLGSILIGLMVTNAFANKSGIDFKIQNEHAKVLFNQLTDVPSDGTAGHTFKRGKSIICWHISADMDDEKGNLLPFDDARRYGCSIHFYSDGYAGPGATY